jgi:hypothetical protein
MTEQVLHPYKTTGKIIILRILIVREQEVGKRTVAGITRI